ncbi:hypothetical protein BDW59DRAFT_142349 [Aspergillus cavernicola]|uniref:Uncharacterized protein n=1 Tax=Aspergillus cavernicola TaxID=176166 RepID=A0ABR4IN71_9EURO
MCPVHTLYLSQYYFSISKYIVFLWNAYIVQPDRAMRMCSTPDQSPRSLNAALSRVTSWRPGISSLPR